jgi:hypothetical protein
MLTIDYRDLSQIKNELVIYVSDKVGAIPTLKINEFVLSSLDDELIDKNLVISAIREFLESIGENQNFYITSDKDSIFIKSISGKPLERSTFGNSEIFSCSHCGFVTRYESEHQNHMILHYL